MMSVSEAIPPTPRQIADPHRKSLLQLVDEMPNQPAQNIIEQHRLMTAEILKSYGSQMGAFIASQDKEAKTVVNSVAQLTETLSSLEQRYNVKFQGIAKKLRLLAASSDLSAELTQLERTLEEQQRDTRSAINRLNEAVSTSEVRKQRAIPGPGSQHASDSLLALDRAVNGWDRYCLVRYEFQARPGVPMNSNAWQSKEGLLLEAIPERVGHNVRVVIPKSGVMLAAIHCQLLEYAGQAESMEKSLSQLTGALCSSRVVEPQRGEEMREAMVRLEKAG